MSVKLRLWIIAEISEMTQLQFVSAIRASLHIRIMALRSLNKGNKIIIDSLMFV